MVSTSEYGRPAFAYEQAAVNAPYPAQSYPGAPSYNQGSQDGSAETSGLKGGYGGGRYTDRDAEGYHSDRDDKGSGPYNGGNSSTPPSRTLILEGLPFEMTQEDVRTPVHPSLSRP